MKYQYNFGFFDEWIKANPQIKKKALLDALGIKADSGMKKWADRRYPMPVISMLRFCNSFNVPLSAFFRDMDADEQPTTIPHPTINDQLEPDGGYIKPGEERQRGEHTILNPLAVEVMESNMPDSFTIPMLPRKEETSETMQKESEAKTQGTQGVPTPSAAVLGSTTPGAHAPSPSSPTPSQPNSTPSQPSSAAPSPTPTLDANALLTLETTHAAQRDRLLDIIADQQRTIADLTTQLAQLSQSPTPTYRVVKEYAPNTDTLGMVAEPDSEA